jgi:pimeloyl-ACP methyl ester carboxylesterase
MLDDTLGRRPFLLATAALAAGCAGVSQASTPPPIVFMHGNGDTAALWLTTLWRFESNGWPRNRLHAVHLPYPLARDRDDTPQSGRTSATEARQFLAAEVDQVLAASGATQVVLMANSRGGNAVRSFIAQGGRDGGAAKVSHAILCGTPNHGVRADPANNPANEFNGAGPFLQGLNNQGGPGIETTPGPRWMTIRSDNNDKYAQPDGAWLGSPGKPTGVGFDSPELRGASNLVLPGIDHRETAFSTQAFAVACMFITGQPPASLQITPEPSVLLDGQVNGQGLNNDPATGSFPSNLPLPGALVEIYAVDPASGERIGGPRWRRSVAADGRWGPFAADPQTSYEFVVSAPGYATTHIYREPFPRSSSIVHLRAERLLEADKSAGAVLTFTRPRGYFGLPRDRIVFDGQNPAPGIPPGVAGVSASKIKLPPGPQRSVLASFNGQRIAARNWPAADNHIVLLELH